MKKLAIGSLVGAVLLVGACTLLLPERFAVNAPIRHMLFGTGGIDVSETDVGRRIHAPEGFSIELFASGIPNARWLRPTPSGAVLVSLPRSGSVLRLEPDLDGDGRSDGRLTLLEGLNRPHGLELHDGWLYVGEGDAIGRVRLDPTTDELSGAYAHVVEGLPSGGNHWSRTVRIGPDGWMYVSVGSSCNVCEDDPRRAAILRFRLDGSDEQVYATGLRNAVGFDWQPGTGELYATDNGRDLLGDDFPPCELNRVVEGAFYGWPYANGDGVPDPDFGASRPELVQSSISPAHGFRAHNAPLGITFIRGDAVPDGYRGAALVALHGSWNRRSKDGYKVVSLHWGPDGRIEERDFVVGFEVDDDVSGRPVDVAEGPDGSFYISDDYAGAVYRVAYGAGAASLAGDPARSASAAATPGATLGGDFDAGAAQRGAALYEEFRCASCHEPERADPGVVVVELRDLRSRHSIDSLAEFFVTPTPPMPAFPMDASQRQALAVFLLGER